MIEKSINVFEERLADFIDAFNKRIALAVERMSPTMYPLEARVHLVNARVILREISQTLEGMKVLENNLIKLVQKEKTLLKKERKIEKNN